ncbi:MAG: ABC-2 family transporter protein [Deltaproteobacteria bacterium ADurb.Bin510]|nr:MAG: ABC-2 family transporter protein [Deltaproteobacteria bacterium ADurb.Bin510]
MPEQAHEMVAPITIVQHRLFNPYTNYQYYLSAGFMPTVLQMFIIMASLLALGIELKTGTAGEWLDAAHGNTAAAVMGKLCPYTACFFLEGVFMVSMLVRYGGTPLWGHMWIILLGLLAYILAYQAVAVTILGSLANMRFAMTVGASYASIGFTFCGLTFPAMAMPLAVRYIGDTIPLTHYLRIYISQSLRGAPLGTDIPSLCALLAFLALPLLVRSRWHRILREEQYWGGL